MYKNDKCTAKSELTEYFIVIVYKSNSKPIKICIKNKDYFTWLY